MTNDNHPKTEGQVMAEFNALLHGMFDNRLNSKRPVPCNPATSLQVNQIEKSFAQIFGGKNG